MADDANDRRGPLWMPKTPTPGDHTVDPRLSEFPYGFNPETQSTALLYVWHLSVEDGRLVRSGNRVSVMKSGYRPARPTDFMRRPAFTNPELTPEQFVAATRLMAREEPHFCEVEGNPKRQRASADADADDDPPDGLCAVCGELPEQALAEHAAAQRTNPLDTIRHGSAVLAFAAAEQCIGNPLGHRICNKCYAQCPKKYECAVCRSSMVSRETIERMCDIERMKRKTVQCTDCDAIVTVGGAHRPASSCPRKARVCLKCDTHVAPAGHFVEACSHSGASHVMCPDDADSFALCIICDKPIKNGRCSPDCVRPCSSSERLTAGFVPMALRAPKCTRLTYGPDDPQAEPCCNGLLTTGLAGAVVAHCNSSMNIYVDGHKTFVLGPKRVSKGAELMKMTTTQLVNGQLRQGASSPRDVRVEFEYIPAVKKGAEPPHIRSLWLDAQAVGFSTDADVDIRVQGTILVSTCPNGMWRSYSFRGKLDDSMRLCIGTIAEPVTGSTEMTNAAMVPAGIIGYNGRPVTKASLISGNPTAVISVCVTANLMPVRMVRGPGDDADAGAPAGGIAALFADDDDDDDDGAAAAGLPPMVVVSDDSDGEAGPPPAAAGAGYASGNDSDWRPDDD